MRKTFGLAGMFGLVLVIAGLIVIALDSLLIAGGLALVLLGVGMAAYGMISNFMQAMGLGMGQM